MVRATLAEEVSLGRNRDVGRAAVALDFEPAQNRHRDAVELPHRELGGRGNLVGHRNDRRAHPDDRSRLLEDRLDAPGIALVAGDLARALRRLDRVEAEDAALDLRDRLLRDDDDVPVLELDALDDQLREVVVLVQLRDPLDGDDRVTTPAHGSPTMWTPACPL